MIRVALADDHEIVRHGIKMVLEDDPQIKVIWEAADGMETMDKMGNEPPDVLVVDIRMPLMTGLEVTKNLKKADPSVKILVLTMHDDSEYIHQSLEYGADGYLLKDTNKSEFNKAVHMVNNGQKYFSGDISSSIVDFYTKTVNKQIDLPESLHNDDYQLTRREKEILKLIYDGVSNKDIAEKLSKSIRTIETHRFNIMKKLDVNNITELFKKVEREGIIDGWE